MSSGVGLAAGLGETAGLGEGAAVGVAAGVGVADGVGVGVGVAEGLGVGVAAGAPFTWTTAAFVLTLPVSLLYSQSDPQPFICVGMLLRCRLLWSPFSIFRPGNAVATAGSL